MFRSVALEVLRGRSGFMGRSWFVMLSYAPALAVVLTAAGCSSHGPGQPASSAATASPTPEPTALPSVAPAPRASLPPWIVSVSPTGEAKDGAQIRVRFKSDVVPVEVLEAPDRQAALSRCRDTSFS
jgi:hypothetical protein